MMASAAPSRRSGPALRRRAACVLTLIAAPLLARCDRPETPAPAAEPAPTPAVQPSPALTRSDLLAAVDLAASDAAAGVIPSGPDPLVGRRFTLGLAFGCFGPDPGGVALDNLARGLPRWAWGQGNRSIRLSLTVDDWSSGDVTGPAVAGFPAVDGVWINQPWMRRDGCPAPALPVTEATPAPTVPTVGVAMLREAGAPPDLALILRGGDGAAPVPSPRGYRLVLEGRVAAWAEGRAIRCLAVRPTAPPACVVGTRIDRLAFTDGATGEVLGEWRP